MIELLKGLPMTGLIFRQLFDSESSTYTYLLADRDSREAVLIDPVREKIDRDLQLLRELGLKLTVVIDTHVHADHVTAAGMLRERTGARIALSAAAEVPGVDLPLVDDQKIPFGRFHLTALATPGHTDSCMSFFTEGKVFTGDALMIRGNGRTDFQQGSSAKMYRSLRKLLSLPPETEVYPAHDYHGRTKSTVAEETQFNPRLSGNRTEEEFIRIMADVKLPPPKKIDTALPANRALGLDETVFTPFDNGGVPEITVQQLHETLGSGRLGRVRLIDVRRPDEFTGELGHVAGAELITLGPDLQHFLETADKNQEVVFICRSGGRSGQATVVSRNLGWTRTVNMSGGMLRWNEMKLPKE